MQSSGGDEAHDQAAIVISDYFKQAGIDSYPFPVPDAQRSDRELVAQFPGVGVWRGGNNPLGSFTTMHSRNALIAPPWRGGSNRSRYMNPELDALIDRFMVTVSERDRLPLTGQIMRHTTEQLNVMGLWYNVRPNAVGKRLQNVSWQRVTGGTVFWNARCHIRHASGYGQPGSCLNGTLGIRTPRHIGLGPPCNNFVLLRVTQDPGGCLRRGSLYRSRHSAKASCVEAPSRRTARRAPRRGKNRI